MKKPERKNYPTEYTVIFDADDIDDLEENLEHGSVHECKTWREVEKVVHQFYPLAVFDDWWSDIQDKAFFRSANNRAAGEQYAGTVSRSQPEYHAAISEWVTDRAIIENREGGNCGDEYVSDNHGDECMICGEPAELECESCGEMFCCGSCERKHGCLG